MRSKLFDIQNINFFYQLGTEKIQAIHDLSVQLDHGSFTCIAGPSGSGKSTLLSLIGLIEPLQSGEIIFDGKKISNLDEKQKNQIRKHRIGFVFQNFHLFPVLTAFENVTYLLSRQGLSKTEQVQRATHALSAVGILEHKDKKPLQMSGGQRQRVAIARAIAKNPGLIIADEPTASLDQKTGSEVMTIFSELNRKTGVTIIVSSHDPMVIASSRSLIKMKDGKIQSHSQTLSQEKSHDHSPWN